MRRLAIKWNYDSTWSLLEQEVFKGVIDKEEELSRHVTQKEAVDKAGNMNVRKNSGRVEWKDDPNTPSRQWIGPQILEVK